MRVRASECASLFFDDGRLVWDDYLDHRQLAITSAAERVLRAFASWRELDDAGDDERGIAVHLLDAGLLVAEGSERHEREQALLARWRAWGSSARHYHFASRTLPTEAYMSLDADAESMRAAPSADAPAPAFRTFDDAPITALPAQRPAVGTSLVDALYARRSIREFSPAPVALGALAGVLEAANGVVDVRETDGAGTAVFRTSPSAGATAPHEVYAHVSRVDGLAPGVYHHAPLRGGLERVGEPAAHDELLRAVGGQPWLAAAPVLLVYTGVLERMQRRYSTARAYRDLLIGLGHVSQTALLVAAASGLGAVFATAVCEESLERIVGCGGGEVVLGVAAIGNKP